MKRLLSFPVLAALALGACSGSSSVTDAGPGDAGGDGGPGGIPSTINVTLTTIGVHPAAAAALQKLGLTPPALVGNYVLLQGVSLDSNGSPKISDLAPPVQITSANAAGPIAFQNVPLVGDGGVGLASLGLISAIVSPAVVAGGTPPAIQWPTCAELASGLSPDGGFVDGFIPAGAQVHFGRPTTDVTSGVAMGFPGSFVAILDCADGLTPGATGADGGPAADLLAQGFAPLYVSSTPAGGSPVAGVTFSGAAAPAVVTYFPASYAAGSASTTAPTDTNGLALITGVGQLATINGKDASGKSYGSFELSTPGGSAYQVFFSPTP